MGEHESNETKIIYGKQKLGSRITFQEDVCFDLFLFRQCKNIDKYNISVKTSYIRNKKLHRDSKLHILNKNYITYINCILSIDHWSYKEEKGPEDDTESLITRHLYKYTQARPLMKTLNAINIYQINIFQTLVFMVKLKNNMAPKVFHNQFKSIQHEYPTKYSI